MKEMAKAKIDIERCKGCGLCIVNCPKNLIKISTNLNKKGFSYAVVDSECNGCGFCFQICPDNAVKVR